MDLTDLFHGKIWQGFGEDQIFGTHYYMQYIILYTWCSNRLQQQPHCQLLLPHSTSAEIVSNWYVKLQGQRILVPKPSASHWLIASSNFTVDTSVLSWMYSAEMRGVEAHLRTCDQGANSTGPCLTDVCMRVATLWVDSRQCMLTSPLDFHMTVQGFDQQGEWR